MSAAEFHKTLDNC